jgi:hypothetical protein
MVALQAGLITRVSLADVMGHLKMVDDRLWDVANALFEARLDGRPQARDDGGSASP